MLIATLEVIQRLTDSSLALGAMGVSIALPTVLFGLVAGVFVDRLDRKLAMIVSDVVRGLAVLVLLTVQSSEQIWILFLVGFVMGSMGIFFAPARNAVLPNIIDEELLLPANTLVQGTQVISMALGPTLAGLIVGWFGTDFAFAFDSLTFFVSAVAIATLSISQKRADDEKATVDVVWAQLKEGLTFIRRSRIILNISITAGVAMLGLGSILVLGVRYLSQELGIGTTGFGFLVSVLGMGMVAGGFLVGNYAGGLRTSVVVGGGMGTLGLALLGFAMAPDYTLVLVMAFVIGACMVAARAAIAALLQATVPDEKRGRIESAVNTIISASTTLSMGVAGFLGDFLGIRPVFALAGTITLAAAAMAFYILREAESAPREVEVWEASVMASDVPPGPED
ncbi:MAG: putative bacilysin exporter BacE [Anaerolineales bacterium]|nr:putative bacilysin exporter BacE [Anaerolineales bacterium]